MGIKYAVASGNKSFIRPTGYTFPAGLNTLVAGTGSIDYLVVAGGGGGGVSTAGGGGGAGGFLTASGTSVSLGTAYTVTVVIPVPDNTELVP